ncbi:MAG TPA: type II secretion system F family protein [Syntrophorhabdus sp.]|jgi:type II secretory pathway component PulF|nr:type II secretion system F family protein [Syntrophorhabdus sp.]MDI9556730.1 type II secretion system F family protein [Pseudomonadota bacterium]OPX92723.1 MAG: Type II secretion system protein F [Syntrophorhabdus sp. PtaB.Bin027]OQB76694.1 MAG: Type II secretion system protein F [Deltaproteobacteria bacterium ADurb.Bin135]MBP8744792.1 type II secretion system F family protein [Syntrophorhabdus sp.]
MGKFTYKARDEKGSLVTGIIEGDNRRAAYAQIDALGLFPVAVSEAREEIFSIESFLTALKPVRYDDIIFFTRQLQTVIRAGIPILSGLRALEEQTSNVKLRGAIREMVQDIDKGASLSDAMMKQKKLFPDLYTSMVKAGEIGGSLEEVLERLATLLEFQLKTKEMLKSAIRYPIFVVTTLLIAFLVLINFVVPRFAVLFRGAKMDLPLPTRMLLLTNDIFQNYAIYLGISIFILIGGFLLYKRTDAGTLEIDRLKLRAPLIGPIILKICMSRFANMFENLIKVGIPVVRTLEVVSRTVGNEYIAQKIIEISGKIERGLGISRPLREAEIFPPLIIHLISTGEQTGSLEDMLKEVSTHYDREITYSINRLSTWIEPLLTAGLSLMVLFLALAIFLPWWNMMGALRGGG